MVVEKITLDKSGIDGFSGGFCAIGSFGAVDGMDTDMKKISQTDDGFCGNFESFIYTSETSMQKNGVCVRNDSFKPKNKQILNKLAVRFYLEGGDYEAFAQYSTWQTESSGGWQNVVTGVEIMNNGIRTTDGAAPMLALRNKGNGRIFVFHLLPNCAWKITAKHFPVGSKHDAILIEMGMNCDGLNMALDENEVIRLPTVIFYETENTLDFDCHKLHEVYNNLYPRKSLPIIYNTWMCDFDKIDADSIKTQIDTASQLGIEYFVVDAGWFGETENWGEGIGDWRENKLAGFKGRMKEVSDYVISKGMKYGLWFEPERALMNSPVYKAHPEFFSVGTHGNCFLDFSNTEARRYITNTIIGMIEQYNISYLKFDFNAALAFDKDRCAFYRYFEGQKEFVGAIRSAYPDIYITNCASGGTRMDMGQNTVFDSCWISDNQSPVEALRIFADTALRLPPSNMEKYDTRLFSNIFPKYGVSEKATLPLSCDGATWEAVVTVSEEFTQAFIKGGVMGFSANIASYPESVKESLKKLISGYKKDRDFYINAQLRILYRSPDIITLQYSDYNFNRIIIHAFARYAHVREISVFPAVSDGVYMDSQGKELAATNIRAQGITVPVYDNNCTEIEYFKEKTQ